MYTPVTSKIDISAAPKPRGCAQAEMPIFEVTGVYSALIIRHKKENLKKCSLTPLEKRDDLLFIRYPFKELPDLSNTLMLTLDGPVLSEKDTGPILLIDATWRYAEKIIKSLPPLEKRTLPAHFKTAYPRYQTGCPNPHRGLSSVEALYVAFLITNRPTDGLLDNYYWKDQFLTQTFCSKAALI